MPLAHWEKDGNRWLDETKVKFTTAIDAQDEAASADAIVKSYLIDVYDSTLVASWDESGSGAASTPALVRYVAGRLMAAYRYARKYSQQDNAPGEYAQWLEDGAMAILLALQAGTLLLPEVGTTSPTDFTEAQFWPNDTTEFVEPGAARKFTMGLIF